MKKMHASVIESTSEGWAVRCRCGWQAFCESRDDARNVYVVHRKGEGQQTTLDQRSDLVLEVLKEGPMLIEEVRKALFKRGDETGIAGVRRTLVAMTERGQIETHKRRTKRTFVSVYALKGCEEGLIDALCKRFESRPNGFQFGRVF